MNTKMAVVTGANKGLGLGIVKLLCKRGVGIVYLTSRDHERGLRAVTELKTIDLKPLYHQLDVSSEDSVQKFADYIKKNHGGFDILINNAGLANDVTKLNYEDAKKVIDINYRGNLTIQKYLFPLLNDNGRVVNISSDCGLISNLKNDKWVQRLIKKDVELEDVNSFVEWFLEAVKNDVFRKTDFILPEISPYIVSKIALNALTRIQQREVKRGISVNSIDPGLIQTDMTGGCGDITVEEASEAPVYLALDIDQSYKGLFFQFKESVDWSDVNIKMDHKLEDHLKKIFINLDRNMKLTQVDDIM